MKKTQAYKIVDNYYLFDDLDAPKVDWRKLKRAENKVMPQYNLLLANNRGAHDAVLGRHVSPYPPGARHEQWVQGNRSRLALAINRWNEAKKNLEMANDK